MGRPAKYIYNIGDVVDDYKCIGIEKDSKNYVIYRMKCNICGKEKLMKGSTIFLHKGTSHKHCGKGLGVTINKKFYNKWQRMRLRTSDKFWDRKDYYDRGINSDAFASYKDFYDTMYESWLDHIDKYGENNTSLERIDVDGNYCPENCKWVTLKEQKDNMQKTVYFKVTDLGTNITEYHKNVRKYYTEHNLPKYIEDVVKYNRKYKGKKYQKISKEEYNENKKCND